MTVTIFEHLPCSQAMLADKSREGFFCKTCGPAQHRSLTFLQEIAITNAPILVQFSLSWFQDSKCLNSLNRRWSVVWWIQVGFTRKDGMIYLVKMAIVSETKEKSEKWEDRVYKPAKPAILSLYQISMCQYRMYIFLWKLYINTYLCFTFISIYYIYLLKKNTKSCSKGYFTQKNK